MSMSKVPSGISVRLWYFSLAGVIAWVCRHLPYLYVDDLHTITGDKLQGNIWCPRDGGRHLYRERDRRPRGNLYHYARRGDYRWKREVRGGHWRIHHHG
jgi:hypothetical protein